MNNRYKIIISNKNIYKEIELAEDAINAKIGTGIDCTYRLLRDLFFEPIELTFQKKGDRWLLICSDNLYITVDDVRKLMTKDLVHGDVFQIRYQESNNIVFTVEFLIDFGSNRKYERFVETGGLSSLRIGADASSSIVLKSQFVSNDSVVIDKRNEYFEVKILNSRYGVYINDKKVKSGEKLYFGDFLSIADYSFYCTSNGMWTEIRDDMSISGIKYYDYPNPNQYPKFIRNVRVHGKIDEENISILDPATKPDKPKNNLFMSLLPSMGMMLTSGAMAMQGGGTMIVFSIASAGMAVVTAVLGFADNKKDYKKSLQKRIDEYNAYIDRKRKEIESLRAFEKQQLEELYPNAQTEQKLISEFSSDLFDRLPEDPDFLFVRLGSGSVEAKRKIEYKKQEKLETEDELQLIPEQIKKECVYIENAPVICDFKTANGVCIVGAEPFRFGLFKNIILDICSRHFYSDIEMIFVAEEKNKDKISWLRFLPNVNNEETGTRNIVCDDESKNRIFDYLYKVLSAREAEKKDKIVFKHIIVFFYDEYGFQKHPISKFIAKGNELGVTFVFMAEDKSFAPVGCSFIINVDSDTHGKLIDASNKEIACDFSYSAISDFDAKRIANYMAPVYTEEISLEGTLTKNISMFEMLNILMVDDIDLKSNWSKSLVYKSMAAPIGVTKNSYVYLDLHDKAHGPHGLVAGTTGSGKSEILQTYILSIATLFHPYEVAFVIIDFKGGGMVNQFKDLPHLLGAITNIDGKEIDRSLKSIKAELQKRQRLFAEADVNHIDKYIKKYKAGEVKIPIPHLILIVDEFAELKAEQPDFMKELISAARIGRSLGVHLILATQKPSGQVDDQIWSNSRFKLCLKVQSVEDSNEVLKSPLAAEIKEPGRAYLQVGNNEIFELFQSAYSGAPEKMADSNVKEFSVSEVSVTGKRKVLFTQKKKKNDEHNLSQLEAIVNHVHKYCTDNNIEHLNSICLPALPDVIEHPSVAMNRDGFIDIGIYDDPDNQIQTSAYVDIDNKNTFIIGSSQYGKTNMLQSIIKTVGSVKTPDQAVFYILDFGSMILKNFESLNNVGGVVTSSEDEKLKNLFKLLFEEIARRKEKLISVGVSSFSSYLEAGYTDLPHIYLMVDNMTALSELYLQDDDSLLSIVRDGIAVGISAIVANSQTSGVGFRYLSNFANKIAFFCNDSGEYGSVFDHVTLKPDEKPGRCVLELDKRMLECQTYLAFKGEKEIDRVNAMHEFIKAANEKSKGKYAKKIPFIPNVLTNESLKNDFNASANGSMVPIGLKYSDVKPMYIDISTLGLIGLCGKEGSGHRNFILNLINAVKSQKSLKSQIVIFDDVTKKYAFIKDKVDEYNVGTGNVGSVIKRWHGLLSERYEQLLFEESENNDSELLIMIVQNNDVASAIQSDTDVSEMFEDIVTRFKDFGVAVIFANFPNSTVSYDAPEAVRTIKQDRKMLFLDDLQNLKVFDVPYEAIRENKKPISAGDGYFIDDNDVIKIKLTLTDE